MNIDNTISTANEITNSGFGGFAVCPFHGLNSTYLGDEWFRNQTKSLSFAAENNMFALLADDIGVLSGTSDGSINSEGIDYQQKSLKF